MPMQENETRELGGLNYKQLIPITISDIGREERIKITKLEHLTHEKVIIFKLKTDTNNDKNVYQE